MWTTVSFLVSQKRSLLRHCYFHLRPLPDIQRIGSDAFGPFQLNDLGDLHSCWIFYEPGGDWFLDSVTINHKMFTYYDWLSERRQYRLRSV
jgi:hypothetical protein